MKLLDILLIGFAIVFIIIGVDQSIAFGFKNSYWAFMLALTFFFLFNLRKTKKKAEESGSTGSKPTQRKRSAKK